MANLPDVVTAILELSALRGSGEVTTPVGGSFLTIGAQFACPDWFTCICVLCACSASACVYVMCSFDFACVCLCVCESIKATRILTLCVHM